MPLRQPVEADAARNPARAEASALDLTLLALRPLLARREVTELCINQPGIAFLETREGWRQERVPFRGFRVVSAIGEARRQFDPATDR